MGCFCCSSAAFWQILVFIHSATCAVPGLASAGLSWEKWFLPLEGGRGFLETSKQLGQGDLSLYTSTRQSLGWQQRSGMLHPLRKGLHCYIIATHSVLGWSWLTLTGNSDVLVAAENGFHPVFCSPCLCLALCRVPRSYKQTYAKSGHWSWSCWHQSLHARWS